MAGDFSSLVTLVENGAKSRTADFRLGTFGQDAATFRLFALLPLQNGGGAETKPRPKV